MNLANFAYGALIAFCAFDAMHFWPDYRRSPSIAVIALLNAIYLASRIWTARGLDDEPDN
jgi:uncharacterized membrane protein YqjE